MVDNGCRFCVYPQASLLLFRARLFSLGGTSLIGISILGENNMETTYKSWRELPDDIKLYSGVNKPDENWEYNYNEDTRGYEIVHYECLFLQDWHTTIYKLPLFLNEIIMREYYRGQEDIKTKFRDLFNIRKG
jgi:hypothetical protein